MPTRQEAYAIINAQAPQDRTREYNAVDQFGRLWLVTVDLKTGGMCCNPTPAGWTDPLATPADYCGLDPRDPMRLFVDFARFVADVEQAEALWQTRYEEEGYHRFGEKFDPSEEPTPAMLRLVGPRPVRRAGQVRAAWDGDPKYLGATPRTNDGHAALLEKIRRLEAEKEALRAENEALAEAMPDFVPVEG